MLGMWFLANLCVISRESWAFPRFLKCWITLRVERTEHLLKYLQMKTPSRGLSVPWWQPSKKQLRGPTEECGLPIQTPELNVYLFTGKWLLGDVYMVKEPGLDGLITHFLCHFYIICTWLWSNVTEENCSFSDSFSWCRPVGTLGQHPGNTSENLLCFPKELLRSLLKA